LLMNYCLSMRWGNPNITNKFQYYQTNLNTTNTTKP
jgi:hypothetical protein